MKPERASRKSKHPTHTTLKKRPVEELGSKSPKNSKSPPIPVTAAAQSDTAPLHLTAISYPGTCLKTGTTLTLIGTQLDREKYAQVVLNNDKEHNFLAVSRRNDSEIVVTLPKPMVLNKHARYHIGLQNQDSLQWISNQLPLPKPCVK